MVARGCSQKMIARRLGLDRMTVNRTVNREIQRWNDEHPDEVEIVTKAIIAELNEIKRECWKAWERSKKNAEKRKTSTDGTKKSAEITTEGQCGDPRYLTVIRECDREIARIRGIGHDEEKQMLPPPVVVPILVADRDEVVSVQQLLAARQGILN